MPTPFYHLSIAEYLLAHPALPPVVRLLFNEQRSAFLLGNTAPDVQVISHQSRRATHFFKLPLQAGAVPPWENILITHPTLRWDTSLPRPQTAFLAGYLCHLQADWYWVKDIFAPAFGPALQWGTFSQRLYLHNVLRAYLDQQVIAILPDGMSNLLKAAEPTYWLPFVEDRYLKTWRDYLALQLEPGAAAETVEVFAARQGLSPAEFYHLLETDDRMDEHVFIHLPRTKLQSYWDNLIDMNLELLKTYFGGMGSLINRSPSRMRNQPGFTEGRAT